SIGIERGACAGAVVIAAPLVSIEPRINPEMKPVELEIEIQPQRRSNPPGCPVGRSGGAIAAGGICSDWNGQGIGPGGLVSLQVNNLTPLIFISQLALRLDREVFAEP